MDDWDASDSDTPATTTAKPAAPPAAAPPKAAAPVKKGKWDDEDAEDDVADDWDASSADESPAHAAATTAAPKPPVAPPKKKGTLKAKLAQKEAERAARLAAGQEIDDGDALDWAEQKRNEREIAKKKEVEADMKNATDLFGQASVSGGDVPSDLVALSRARPKTLPEFQSHSSSIQSSLIAPHATAPLYAQFVTHHAYNLASTLKESEIKALAARLTALANEKARAAKAANAKGKKHAKPTLGGGKSASIYDTTAYEEALDDGDDLDVSGVDALF